MSARRKGKGKPAAKARSVRNSGPDMRSTRRGLRIKHREFVSDLPSMPTFDNLGAFDINPGLSDLFPWLSGQAAGFEQYRFHRLRFEFVTRTGTFNSGSCVMAPDYDPLDDVPESLPDLEAFEGVYDGPIYEDGTIQLSVDDMFPIGPRKYVRSSNEFVEDLRTSDVGRFFIYTTATSGTLVGKLFVHYDVEFFIPQKGSTSRSGRGRFPAQSITFSRNPNVGETITVEEVVSSGTRQVPTSDSKVGLSAKLGQGALINALGNYLVGLTAAVDNTGTDEQGEILVQSYWYNTVTETIHDLISTVGTDFTTTGSIYASTWVNTTLPKLLVNADIIPASVLATDPDKSHWLPILTGGITKSAGGISEYIADLFVERV